MEMYLADSIIYHIHYTKQNHKTYEIEPIKIVPYKTILTEEDMKKLLQILSNVFTIERK